MFSIFIDLWTRNIPDFLMLCLLIFFQIYQITSQSKWHKVTNNSFVFAGMISRPTWFHPSNIWEMKSHSQMLHWHVTDRPVKLTKWFCQLALHTSRYVRLWKMLFSASDNIMTTKDSDIIYDSQVVTPSQWNIPYTYCINAYLHMFFVLTKMITF